MRKYFAGSWAARYFWTHLALSDLRSLVSDRLSAPLLPIRPNLLMVYDYIQRYSVDLVSSDEKTSKQVLNCINTFLY